MTVNIALKKVIDNSYDIIIDNLSAMHFETKVAIVTNPTVAKLHLDFLKTADCILLHTTTEDYNKEKGFISGSKTNVINCF